MKSLLCTIVINFNFKFCLNRISIYQVSATYQVYYIANNILSNAAVEMGSDITNFTL